MALVSMRNSTTDEPHCLCSLRLAVFNDLSLDRYIHRPVLKLVSIYSVLWKFLHEQMVFFWPVAKAGGIGGTMQKSPF